MGGYARPWKEPTSGDEKVAKHLEYQAGRVLFRLAPEAPAHALTEAEADALAARQSRWDTTMLALAVAAVVALTVIWDDWARADWQIPILGASLILLRLLYDWASPRLLFAAIMRRPVAQPAVPLYRSLRGVGWRDLWWDAAKQSAGVVAGAGILLFGKHGLQEGVAAAAICLPAAARAWRRLWVKAFDKALF